MNTNENYFNEVSGHTEFLYDRKIWRDSLKNDKELLEHAKLMQIDLDRHRYTYHWDWMGVPIIKIPDDIMVIQEFYFSYKPTAVVEIGVARGGGMALASSMQMLIGVELNILGVDLKIFEHTHEILRKFGMKGMKLIECDSTSVEFGQ